MPKVPDTTTEFDYSQLDADAAQKAQQAATAIRKHLQRSIEDGIIIGKELIAIKEALEHGQWLGWLSHEFDWSDRTARNYMSLAEGLTSENVSDLRMDLSAGYVLTAKKAPRQALQTALKRCKTGEHITPPTARDIVAECKGPAANGKRPRWDFDRARTQLKTLLNRQKGSWSRHADKFVQVLREYADELEKSTEANRKRKAK